MSLEDKLQAIREGAKKNFPPEVIEKMHKATAELRDSGIMNTALKVDDVLPSFELPNIEKQIVRSQDLLERGPLVLTFYRGAW